MLLLLLAATNCYCMAEATSARKTSRHVALRQLSGFTSPTARPGTGRTTRQDTQGGWNKSENRDRSTKISCSTSTRSLNTTDRWSYFFIDCRAWLLTIACSPGTRQTWSRSFDSNTMARLRTAADNETPVWKSGRRHKERRAPSCWVERPTPNQYVHRLQLTGASRVRIWCTEGDCRPDKISLRPNHRMFWCKPTNQITCINYTGLQTISGIAVTQRNLANRTSMQGLGGWFCPTQGFIQFYGRLPDFRPR